MIKIKFFWPDKDLEKIVKETNLYIKRKRKTKGILKKQNSYHKFKRTKEIYGGMYVHEYI